MGETTTNWLGSMLTPDDVLELDLGAPLSAAAGLRRPAVVIPGDLHRLISSGVSRDLNSVT